MGVKGLWTILEPVGEPCPLSALAGRSVAVDLSGWVVEAETTAALSHAVSRPYLRNLVYRTSALLLQHTLPIYVLDGAAPELKLQELARRQGKQPASCGRQQLRSRLQRCARLLDALGVPHLTADGEAEALCARLDAEGIVDGVVSDDGDAALHGARTLYRHLSAGRTGGEVTRYYLCRARDQLGLDSRRLQDLALLLGCDYLPGGLPGLGPQVAQVLVHRLAGRPLLEQLARWLREPPLSEMRAVGELGRAPSHCVSCRHPGTETQHRRGGCPLCGGGVGCIAAPVDLDAAACPCDWHRQRRAAEEHSAELKARDCARRTPEFEARAAAAQAELSRTPALPEGPLTWRRPDVARFTAEAGQELGWSPMQCWELAAPLLARWQLRHCSPGDAAPLRPLAVLRTSRHHHVDCYLVSWRMEVGGCEQETTTHEPRPLVETAHKQLVDAFLESKKKTRKAPLRQPRKAKGAGDAGPKAKLGVGSPSRLITDFFPTRKKAGRQAVAKPVELAEGGVGPMVGTSGPAPVPGQADSPEPSASSEARAPVTVHFEASSDSPASPLDSAASPWDSPCSTRPPVTPPGGSDSPRRQARAPTDPDSVGEAEDSESDSYEAPDSDGSVADLSAIIDAITRTHIADDDVIVISDDDDVVEVSDGGRSRVDGAPRRTARGYGASPSHSDAQRARKGVSHCDGNAGERLPVGSCSADESAGRSTSPDSDRGAAEPPRYGANSSDAVAAAAVAVSESESDGDEYVPLFRRIALR